MCCSLAATPTDIQKLTAPIDETLTFDQIPSSSCFCTEMAHTKAIRLARGWISGCIGRLGVNSSGIVVLKSIGEQEVLLGRCNLELFWIY